MLSWACSLCPRVDPPGLAPRDHNRRGAELQSAAPPRGFFWPGFQAPSRPRLANLPPGSVVESQGSGSSFGPRPVQREPVGCDSPGVFWVLETPDCPPSAPSGRSLKPGRTSNQREATDRGPGPSLGSANWVRARQTAQQPPIAARPGAMEWPRGLRLLRLRRARLEARRGGREPQAHVRGPSAPGSGPRRRQTDRNPRAPGRYAFCGLDPGALSCFHVRPCWCPEPGHPASDPPATRIEPP